MRGIFLDDERYPEDVTWSKYDEFYLEKVEVIENDSVL